MLVAARFLVVWDVAWKSIAVLFLLFASGEFVPPKREDLWKGLFPFAVWASCDFDVRSGGLWNVVAVMKNSFAFDCTWS